MRKPFVFILAILQYFAIIGQIQAQSTSISNQESPRSRQIQEAAERRAAEESVQRLRAISRGLYSGRRVPRAAMADINALYREPTNKELKKLRPLAEDVQKYSALLRLRRTGIVRLEPYIGCGDSTLLVSANDACLEYPLPGNGSDYSFREGNYKLGRLADLRFGSDEFSGPGVLQQSLFVGLGDIPLEEVQLNASGMDFIKSVEAADHLGKAVAFSREFESGIQKDGYYYAPIVRALENMTYVLRSIAYKGKAMRSIGGFVFNELEFDKRGDVTVAFRIVRTHEGGGITIVWKELHRVAAPELLRVKPTMSKEFTAKRNK